MKKMGAHGPTEWESQMCDAPLIVLLPEVPMTPALEMLLKTRRIKTEQEVEEDFKNM
jgi:hypothetical protein